MRTDYKNSTNDDVTEETALTHCICVCISFRLLLELGFFSLNFVCLSIDFAVCFADTDRSRLDIIGSGTFHNELTLSCWSHQFLSFLFFSCSLSLSLSLARARENLHNSIVRSLTRSSLPYFITHSTSSRYIWWMYVSARRSVFLIGLAVYSHRTTEIVCWKASKVSFIFVDCRNRRRLLTSKIIFFSRFLRHYPNRSTFRSILFTCIFGVFFVFVSLHFRVLSNSRAHYRCLNLR